MTNTGKVILVTGASSGFGNNIANRLASEGHRVFGTSRNATFEGGVFTALELDVTDERSVFDCVDKAVKEAGRIDVLINNAGFGLCGGIEDTSVSEAKGQFETNFWGVVRMTKETLPHMRRQGVGRIVTVGSMAGHVGLPYQAYYSASKHALEAFNESLRLELSGSGIDSTIICPGDFQTGFTGSRLFSASATHHIRRDQFDKIMKIYERDEANGADPLLVAMLVSMLVKRKSIDVRYFTGNSDQRASMFLKRLLPSNMFERLFRSHYQIHQ